MADFAKVEALFHGAAALPPSADQSAWLAAECEGDPRLFQEVSGLLNARAELEVRARTADTAKAPEAPLPSALFGAYRAVRLLGRGGMSAVYLAERADGQYQQQVALKVMAGYLADGEFFRRFEAERQFLAVLNHPNITRLLDGGISPAGDPFLVTEYIDGQSIDRYCEDNKLNIEQRLRIFLKVCEAVEYAHRNLIVHRDLKPANILVNREGQVKLLDFGTASLAQGSQANRTVTRMRMLTPRYASPEQLRGERVNIGTDVFSLGVVLYEMLTGAWPFGDPNSVLRELDRTAGVVSAKPPSSAITEESAKSRSLSRQQLSLALKGDLSAIALKTLEADPAKRYESARALAADLENFLAGRPVLARPQAPLYRAGKFLRRRRLAASTAVVFVLGLAGAAIIAAHQAKVAKDEAVRAEKVNEFMNGMLSSTRQTFTVLQMLEAAEKRLDSNWTGDPRTEATLRFNLGRSYAAVVNFDHARTQMRKALAEFETLGDEKDVALTLIGLADVALYEGHSQEAMDGYEKVLEKTKRLGSAAPNDLIFSAKDHLANTLLLMNHNLPEARTLLDEAISLGNRDPSIPRVDLAIAMGHYATLISQDGQKEESEVMFRKALEIGRKEDPDGLWQAGVLYNLAVLIAPKDPAGTRELAHQRYELLARHLGPDNAQTAVAKILWARARARSGEAPEAATQVLEAMEIVRKQFPEASMDRWVALASAARVLSQAKRFQAAESLAREMLPIVDANRLPENDARRAQSWLELGTALHGENREKEAAFALAKSAAIYDAAGPAWVESSKLARKLLDETRSRYLRSRAL